MEPCVVFQFTTSKPGITVGVPTGDRQVADASGAKPARQSSFKVRKPIIDSNTYRAIGALDSGVRLHLSSQSLRNASGEQLALPTGGYLIPVAFTDRNDLYIRNRLTERTDLVEQFLHDYPAAIEAARVDLEGLFNPRDYPSVEQMRGKFSASHTIAMFTMEPGNMTGHGVSAALFEREQAKARERVREMEEEIRGGIRLAFDGAVSAVFQMLIPKANGASPRVLGTHIDALRSFLGEFSARNVIGDAEMERVATLARGMLDGISADDVRRSQDVRKTLGAGLERVKAALASMTSTNPHAVRTSFIPDIGRDETQMPAAPAAPIVGVQGTRDIDKLGTAEPVAHAPEAPRAAPIIPGDEQLHPSAPVEPASLAAAQVAPVAAQAPTTAEALLAIPEGAPHAVPRKTAGNYPISENVRRRIAEMRLAPEQPTETPTLNPDGSVPSVDELMSRVRPSETAIAMALDPPAWVVLETRHEGVKTPEQRLTELRRTLAEREHDRLTALSPGARSQEFRARCAAIAARNAAARGEAPKAPVVTMPTHRLGPDLYDAPTPTRAPRELVTRALDLD